MSRSGDDHRVRAVKDGDVIGDRWRRAAFGYLCHGVLKVQLPFQRCAWCGVCAGPSDADFVIKIVYSSVGIHISLLYRFHSGKRLVIRLFPLSQISTHQVSNNLCGGPVHPLGGGQKVSVQFWLHLDTHLRFFEHGVSHIVYQSAYECIYDLYKRDRYMSVIGYARVGSIGQKLDVQKDKLEKIYKPCQKRCKTRWAMRFIKHNWDISLMELNL